MELESTEVPSDDVKSLEKNRKRTAKTHTQVQALEKVYNEHKYPTEAIKLQVAESIGLTEKQVSGWFCHRRLKDKKLMNGEVFPSGVVVQDLCSGHKQDSCGSTKQGDNRIFDTKEVESGRLTSKELSAADLTCQNDSNLADDLSSGSSSSLRHGSNHEDRKAFGVAAAASTYGIPKFPSDVKSSKMKPGPSGYLKVKGRVENPEITAVKRHLGKHYRDDGPPLAVEFDPLPPGAFGPSPQDPGGDTCYTGEAFYNTSDTAAKIIPNEKFGGKEYEYKSSMASYHSGVDGTSFEVSRGRDIHGGYIHHQKFKPNTPSSFHRLESYSSEFPEGSDRYRSGSGSRHEYRTAPRGDDMNIDETYPHNPHLKPYSGKVREEPVESWVTKRSDMGTQAPPRQNVETIYYANRKKYHISGDISLSRRIVKDRNDMYHDNMTLDQNPFNAPFSYSAAPERMREDFHGHPKSSLVMSSASFSEDAESGDTASAD